jgi:D-alanyl-D-alanine dipeptidase
MRLWQRASTGASWQPAGEAWPAVVGRTGLAWGRGVHGDGPPAGRDGPRKHEGDGKSPAGLFALGPVFGYDRAPPPGTRLPYTMATDTWRCVDDPSSRHYNRLLDETTVTPDWSSREELRRADDLYRWVVEVAHNPDGNPGSGSCIFLHVWSGPDSATAGCTAMSESILAALLPRLDPSAHPMFVLLTTADYAALASPWGLPAPR